MTIENLPLQQKSEESLDEMRERLLLEECATFPIGRFLKSDGTLNTRKVKQLQPWHQQSALNSFFVLRSHRYHRPGFYGYRKVSYRTASQPVEIWCPDHLGFFQQRASSHMDGHSCSQCAKRLGIRHTEVGDFEVPCIFSNYKLTGDSIIFYNRWKEIKIEVDHDIIVSATGVA